MVSQEVQIVDMILYKIKCNLNDSSLISHHFKCNHLPFNHPLIRNTEVPLPSWIHYRSIVLQRLRDCARSYGDFLLLKTTEKVQHHKSWKKSAILCQFALPYPFQIFSTEGFSLIEPPFCQSFAFPIPRYALQKGMCLMLSKFMVILFWYANNMPI